MKALPILLALAATSAASVSGAEFHVSVKGDDAANDFKKKPVNGEFVIRMTGETLVSSWSGAHAAGS